MYDGSLKVLDSWDDGIEWLIIVVVAGSKKNKPAFQRLGPVLFGIDLEVPSLGLRAPIHILN